jgi:hypothetical protein
VRTHGIPILKSLFHRPAKGVSNDARPELRNSCGRFTAFDSAARVRDAATYNRAAPPASQAQVTAEIHAVDRRCSRWR